MHIECHGTAALRNRGHIEGTELRRRAVLPKEGWLVSTTGRVIGLAIASAMFLFSAYVYTSSGDWVAAVFALGSLGYGVFFLSTAKNSKL